MTDNEEAKDIEIPPDEEMAYDLGMQPTATDETNFNIMSGRGMRGTPAAYFEKAELREDSAFNRQLRLKLTTAQIRRWINLFRAHVSTREQQLDSDLGEAWGMYTVVVREYPWGLSPDEIGDTDPVTSEVVATCWTQKAAAQVRHSIQAGEHPDIDFTAPRRGQYRVEIDMVPLLGEGQELPWKD